MQRVAKILADNPFLRMACVVPVLVLLFFAAGCTHRNKIYDYKDPTVDYDWGRLRARLHENFKSTGGRLIGGVTIQGTTYDLSFVPEVRSDSGVKGSVTVTSVELYDADKGLLVFKRDDILKSVFKRATLDKKLYMTIFFFEDLDLEYARYRLLIRFRVETDEFVAEDVATLYSRRIISGIGAMRHGTL